MQFRSGSQRYNLRTNQGGDQKGLLSLRQSTRAGSQRPKFSADRVGDRCASGSDRLWVPGANTEREQDSSVSTGEGRCDDHSCHPGEPMVRVDGPPDFNLTDLIKRGWTRTAIARILGPPDRRIAPQAFAECKWLASRVYDAEENGPMRYRRPRRVNLAPQKTVRDGWRPHVFNRGNPWPEGVPFDALRPALWLEELSAMDLDVPLPWTVERLVFATDVKTLHVFAGHDRRTRWRCPRCSRFCPLHDHRRESIWFTADMAGVLFVLRGRLPRCFCPKHGARTVPALGDDVLYIDSIGRPKRPLVWEIRASL